MAVERAGAGAFAQGQFFAVTIAVEDCLEQPATVAAWNWGRLPVLRDGKHIGDQFDQELGIWPFFASAKETFEHTSLLHHAYGSDVSRACAHRGFVPGELPLNFQVQFVTVTSSVLLFEQAVEH